MQISDNIYILRNISVLAQYQVNRVAVHLFMWT